MAALPAFFVDPEQGLSDFKAICGQQTSKSDYIFAEDVEQNIVVYNGNTIRSMIGDGGKEFALRTEVHRCLSEGPGVLVVKNAFPEIEIIDFLKLSYAVTSCNQQ